VRRALGGLLAAVLLAPPVQAQRWRTVDAARQRQGTDSVLHVQVEYGAGKMSLAAARPGLLYDVHLRYDADRVTPIRQFTPATRELTIGVSHEDESPPHAAFRAASEGGPTAPHDESANEMTVGLARELPLDLRLDLGAVEARLDLSNVWLDRVRLHTGASDVRLRFGTPNPHPMRSLEILGGATNIRVSGLGNAHADLIHVRAGAAQLDLDFSGAWAGDMEVDLDAALGDVTLRVPTNVGVRITMTRLLADLHAAGFAKHDGAYYSDNWARASTKLTVQARAALGDVTVQRIEQ
jgi:hypothetical protein